MKKLTAFTMMELLIGVLIMAILATIASVGYTRYRDHAAMMVDETNMRVLQAAVKLYAYDNNALPGSLSQLTPGQLDRAYAQVIGASKLFRAYAALNAWVVSVAEAQDHRLPPRYYNNNIATITCPRDKTPPSPLNSNISYRMGPNTVLPSGRGQPLNWYLNPANANEVLIHESDGDSSYPSNRHQGLAVISTVGGKIDRKPGGSGGNT